LATTRFSREEIGHQAATMLFQSIDPDEPLESHTVRYRQVCDAGVYWPTSTNQVEAKKPDASRYGIEQSFDLAKTM
jgi:hypothetical protein